MKYIKTFEILHSKPKIGDFVICDEKHNDNYLNLFLTSNIGRIIRIVIDDIYPYTVEYNNIPDKVNSYFNYHNNKKSREMSNDDIIYCSDNKEDLEIIINTNKFNI